MAFNASPDQPLDVGSLATTTVFRDGLGVRRHIVDPSRGGTVELLCLRPELNAVSSFEFALRERVNRLATFRHAYFAPVRGVERVSDPRDTLAVISDVTQGIRLSELLASLEERHATLDITAALCLIRQIVPAVAMLHETARDVAHGAIGPERLIVTPNARLVLVDYVFGAALEQLRYPHERYWAEFKVAVPKTGAAPRFDHRADVLQIGLVALALILGRPLRRDEFPSHVRELVASAWSASATGGGFEPLPPGLCVWLGRTLQLEALTAFPSAIEAKAELDKIMGDTSHGASPAGLQTVIGRHHGAERPRDPAANSPDPAEGMSPGAVDATTSPLRSIMPGRATPSPRVTTPLREPSATGAVLPRAEARRSSALAALDLEPLAAPPGVKGAVSLPELPPPPPRPQLTVPELPPIVAPASRPAAVLPVLAPEKPIKPPRLTVLDLKPLAEPLHASSRSVDLPELPLSPPPVPKSALTLLDRQPLPAPARDAQQISRKSFYGGRGSGESGKDANPRSEALGEQPVGSRKGFRLWKWFGGAAILLPALVAGGAFTAKRVAPTPPLQMGTLVITTNLDGARALVDGEPRGETPLTIELTAGPHQIDLVGAGTTRTIPVNVGAGMKVEQYVELPTVGPTAPTGRPDGPPARGEVAPAPLPSASPTTPQNTGWITVSSPFAVQIFERGRRLPHSQGDRVTLSPGPHELDLVNEELGFRDVRSVDVKSGKGVTIQPEVPKAAVSLNALPWAEVVIDGESVGETPIGNLSLTIGAHAVVFRHPELGERRWTVVVSLKNPVRISVDLRKK
jgi:serine/threonine protein kinase